MAASSYHVISKEIEIRSLGTIEFIDTHVCINNPHWLTSGITIFLCKYEVVISDTLVVSFLDVLFLLVAVILSEFMRNQKERLSYRKKSIEKSVWRTSRFRLHALLSVSFFVTFFVYCLSLPKWRTCWMDPTKIHNIAMAGILCDETMSERSKIWQSLAI